jgi:hypothetical protein
LRRGDQRRSSTQYPACGRKLPLLIKNNARRTWSPGPLVRGSHFCGLHFRKPTAQGKTFS